jgi:hypothetical protein
MTAVAKIGLDKAIAKAERSELIAMYEEYAGMGREWLRRQILVNNRIDILATYVLGYKMMPMHMAIMRYQFLHRESLQLVFRGAGKSTCGSVCKILHIIAKDPNVRILIASHPRRWDMPSLC